MRGSKAKVLRKMAYAVGGPDFPETEYVKRPFDKQFIIQTASGPKIVTLKLHQIFLGKCKRAVYKNIKKVYKIGQRQGLNHA